MKILYERGFSIDVKNLFSATRRTPINGLLCFVSLFLPRYFRNASYKWVDFLDFRQIIQNKTTGEWKYDETFFYNSTVYKNSKSKLCWIFNNKGG